MGHRGGANPKDYMANYANADTCSRLCERAMNGSGAHVCPPYCGYDSYYAKCFDGLAPTPLNNIRLAFASQFGTNEIDPDLPQMQVGNVTACMRMNLYIT